MSTLLSKDLHASPIRVTGGSGARLFDDQGREYLDSCGGVVVSSLGHDQPAIVEAMRTQAAAIAWAHAGSFSAPAAEALADHLVSRSEGLVAAQFLSGGSEGVELALKLAYQHHCEHREPQRTIFLARRQNYHGSTFGSLAITGNLQRRDIFERLLPPSEFVAPCYTYRDQRAAESEEAYGQRLAKELDERIQMLGPESVAAFVAETVVGSTSGAVPPVRGYFRAVREVCDRHGVLLILDEVMAGLGRTGRYFAYQEDEVLPDIAVVGKGLAAGYQPISAVLIGANVYDSLAEGSGIIRNGQTYVNHPVACATALSVQRHVDEHDLVAQARERGSLLRSGLERLMGKIAEIGDVRGRGLFIGVELVADRETKTPLPRELPIAKALKVTGLANGLLTYPGSGTIDGLDGHHVLFAPPFVSTEADIEEMIARFEKTLVDVLERREQLEGESPIRFGTPGAEEVKSR